MMINMIWAASNHTYVYLLFDIVWLLLMLEEFVHIYRHKFHFKPNLVCVLNMDKPAKNKQFTPFPLPHVHVSIGLSIPFLWMQYLKNTLREFL